MNYNLSESSIPFFRANGSSVLQRVLLRVFPGYDCCPQKRNVLTLVGVSNLDEAWLRRVDDHGHWIMSAVSMRGWHDTSAQCLRDYCLIVALFILDICEVGHIVHKYNFPMYSCYLCWCVG